MQIDRGCVRSVITSSTYGVALCISRRSVKGLGMILRVYLGIELTVCHANNVRSSLDWRRSSLHSCIPQCGIAFALDI